MFNRTVPVIFRDVEVTLHIFSYLYHIFLKCKNGFLLSMFAVYGVSVLSLLYPVIFYRWQLILVCKNPTSLKQTLSVRNGS